MTKTFKKIISITIALAMVVVTPVSAFAKEWYLENGDILIEANKDGQWVTQGDVTEEDDAPVITHEPEGPGYSDENNITVETEDDAVAEFTIKNIDLGMGYNDYEAGAPSIDIGDSKAEMTVEGYNTIYHYDEYSDVGSAAIHVSGGELTIKGDGVLEINSESQGAKIGSNENEDMSGTIHITDNVEIDTDDDGSADGAAIGSGEYGDFTGKIIIDGNAVVEAKSNDRGAGIGAGEGDYIYDEDGNEIGWGGDFRGEVIIGGNAYVRADGDDDAAGIGSGEDGTFSGGSITIKDYAVVEATGSDEGPGIGAADDTTLDGDIIIKDNAKVYVSGGSETTPDIGSEGGIGGDKGSISILGNATVDTSEVPKLDEYGDFVYDENGNYIMIKDTMLKIGGEYPEGYVDEYGEEYHALGGKIVISSEATIAGFSGEEILNNPELADNLAIYGAEIVNEEEEPDGDFDWFDWLLENMKNHSSDSVTVETEEEEDVNPNTGAPVIMEATNVVFIPVAVTAKKREE